nr:23S ribosomal RNA methyltransferase Erm [Pseudalkalibacillus decolorationis]
MKKHKKQYHKVRKCVDGPNFSGQHLMHNKQILKSIVKQADIKSTDLVMDIGAGKGALTFPLAEKAKKVLAVENDPVFSEILSRKASGFSNIHIIERDFLMVHLPKEPFCVVANVPYAITTPILKKLLNRPDTAFQRAVLTIEKGAAKRFTANTITNPLILRWRMWFNIEITMAISRENFSPPPKVDSALIRIQRKKNPLVEHKYHSKLASLAEYGLKYPHLPIHDVLKGIFTAPQMKQLIKNMRVKRDAPISSLKEHQWGVVFNTMIQYVEPYRWPKMKR